MEGYEKKAVCGNCHHAKRMGCGYSGHVTYCVYPDKTIDFHNRDEGTEVEDDYGCPNHEFSFDENEGSQ